MGIVDKYIGSTFLFNEPISFLVAKPLYNTVIQSKNLLLVLFSSYKYSKDASHIKDTLPRIEIDSLGGQILYFGILISISLQGQEKREHIHLK